MCKYMAAVMIAKALAPLYDQGDHDLNKQIEFTVGNSIFKAPNIFTGKSTVAAQYVLRPGIAGRAATWEHIWGRSLSAVTLIKQIKRGRSDKFLKTLVKSRARVNIALREENQLLKPYQNNSVLSKRHPNIVYAAAGLQLVDYVGPKLYNIEGVIYDDRNAVMKKYDINSKTLTYRLTTPSKCWSDWSIVYTDGE